MGKKIFRVIGRILIAALLCVALILGIAALRQMFIWEQYNTKKIETKIISVNIYDGGATLDVLIGDNVDQIILQKKTIIRDKKGKRLSYEDLEAGQKIEVTVEDSVRSIAWTDAETGKRCGADVYYRCYIIVVK